jgi:hypothetical protein
LWAASAASPLLPAVVLTGLTWENCVAHQGDNFTQFLWENFQEDNDGLMVSEFLQNLRLWDLLTLTMSLVVLRCWDTLITVVQLAIFLPSKD